MLYETIDLRVKHIILKTHMDSIDNNFIMPTFSAEIQCSPHQSTFPVPNVSEVIPIPRAASGAYAGTRGAAGYAGEALRMPRLRQEVPEVGGSMGSQEDPCRGKVGTSSSYGTEKTPHSWDKIQQEGNGPIDERAAIIIGQF